MIGKIEFALDFVLLSHDHIVAQEVKAELVVGAIGYIAFVRLALVFRAHSRHDDADGKPQKLVEFAHPGCVAGLQDNR